MKKTILTLLFFSFFYAWGKEENIVFRFYGGGFSRSYIDDRLEITPKGELFYRTISPTISKGQTLIGSFRGKAEKRHYQVVKKFIQDNKTTLPPATEENSFRGFIEELKWGNKVFRWRPALQNVKVFQVRKILKKLALKAYKKPESAMALECLQTKGGINCQYQNRGTKTIHTVNPLSFPSTIKCYDIRMKTTLLYRFSADSFTKKSLKKITLSSQGSYDFFIPTKHICDYRIVVTTTNLPINSEFRELLLGELVSNRLKK